MLVDNWVAKYKYIRYIMISCSLNTTHRSKTYSASNAAIQHSATTGPSSRMSDVCSGPYGIICRTINQIRPYLVLAMYRHTHLQYFAILTEGYHTKWYYVNHDIEGLPQDCSNSIAIALEPLQSCTRPLMSHVKFNPRCIYVYRNIKQTLSWRNDVDRHINDTLARTYKDEILQT